MIVLFLGQNGKEKFLYIADGMRYYKPQEYSCGFLVSYFCPCNYHYTIIILKHHLKATRTYPLDHTQIF